MAVKVLLDILDSNLRSLRKLVGNRLDLVAGVTVFQKIVLKFLGVDDAEDIQVTTRRAVLEKLMTDLETSSREHPLSTMMKSKRDLKRVNSFRTTSGSGASSGIEGAAGSTWIPEECL